MLLILLLIHLILLINTRFTLWPEMVVYPYLLNNGFVLYKEIINPYPPIFTSFLAIFGRFFGYQPLSYQILTWIIILIIDLAIFWISKAIFKKVIIAIISVLFFVIFSVPFSVNGLWYDLVQTPLILAFAFYFIRFLSKTKQDQKNFFYAVLSLTIAFFIKQQAIWVAFLFILLLILKFRKKLPQVLLSNSVAFLPFFILIIFQLVVFSFKKSLGDFVFWTLYFPFIKASQIPGYVDLPALRQLLIVVTGFLVFSPTIFGRQNKNARLLILVSLPTLFFAYPRFDYFHLVPALAILAVGFGQNLKDFWNSSTRIRIICAISLILFCAFTARYFLRNWSAEVRFFEKDIWQAASLIQQITPKDQPLYIQNGPDQLFALSGRLPPKPWVDEFPWYFENNNLEAKVIEGIDREKPRFIIFKPYDQGPKYALGAYRPQELADYLDQNYQNLLQISDTLWLKVRK